MGAFDLPFGIAEFFADVDQPPAFEIFHITNFSLDLGELCPLHQIQISLDRWNIFELLTGHPLLVIQKTSAFLYGTGAVGDDTSTCGHIVCPFGVEHVQLAIDLLQAGQHSALAVEPVPVPALV